MYSLVIIWISALILQCSPDNNKTEEVDLEEIFSVHKVNGCFILLNTENNKSIEYKPERCRQRFMPKSTLKIPHALIALEEGVLRDEKQVIPWDGIRHPVEALNQNQILASAIKYSCVWFFTMNFTCSEFNQETANARMEITRSD